jgi:hypothetical protein
MDKRRQAFRNVVDCRQSDEHFKVSLQRLTQFGAIRLLEFLCNLVLGLRDLELALAMQSDLANSQIGAPLLTGQSKGGNLVRTYPSPRPSNRPFLCR